MVRLRDVFARVQGCHPYTNVGHGNNILPIAYRCSDIVSVIRAFVSRRCSQHPQLNEQELIYAIGKDLVAMGVIRVLLPKPKSWVSIALLEFENETELTLTIRSFSGVCQTGVIIGLYWGAELHANSWVAIAVSTGDMTDCIGGHVSNSPAFCSIFLNNWIIIIS